MAGDLAGTALQAACRATGPRAKVQGSGSPIASSGRGLSVSVAPSQAGSHLGSDAETGVAPG